MDFIINSNVTAMDPNFNRLKSPVTVSLVFTALAIAVISALTQIWHLWFKSKVDTKSPTFTSDALPFLGSLGYMFRQWDFWKACRDASKTGNFSFWMGKRHVVGITGPAARKLFYDHPKLNFISGALILPLGLQFWHNDIIPEVFRSGFASGKNNSFFLRRLWELMKTEQLNKRLPHVLKDTRTAMEQLMINNPSSVTKPLDIWSTVFKQNVRLTFTDEVADDPKIFADCLADIDLCLHTVSVFQTFVPWFPEPSYLKRRFARRRLEKLVTNVLEKRMSKDSVRRDDPLQFLIDNGDRKDHMVEFFVTAIFVSTVNGHVLAGQMLNIMAIHQGWQEKIFSEIKLAADTHCKNKDLKLVDKLSSIPLEAWETSFPSLSLCFKEAIRMWTSFAATRFNTSNEPIPIPGSDEVIPAKTFVAYNTTEVNFSEELYPEPRKFDPERFREGREEFKNEAYGFVGWGHGLHACPGTRWAKMQQNFIVVYALAMYKWTSCDENGNIKSDAIHKRELNAKRTFVPPTVYCKLEPRE